LGSIFKHSKMKNHKIHQGDTLYSEGQIEKALNLYLDCLFETEPDSELYMKIAHCNKLLLDSDNALEYYEKSLEKDSKNIESMYNLAEIYLEKYNEDEATKHFKRILELSNPESSIAHLAQEKIDTMRSTQLNREGGELMSAGNYEEALDVFLEAIELNPKDKRNYLNIGVIFIKNGDLDKAKEWIHKAIEIAPDYIRAYFNLGTLYLKTSYYKIAQNIYKQAILIDPTSKDAADIDKNLKIAEDCLNKALNDLLGYLKGQQMLMNTSLTVELLNQVCPEEINSYDVVYSESGRIRIIAYSKKGIFECSILQDKANIQKVNS